MSNDMSRDVSPHKCPECNPSIKSPDLIPAGMTITFTKGVAVEDTRFGWYVTEPGTTTSVKHTGPLDIHQANDAASITLPAGLTFCWCAIAENNNNYFRIKGTPTTEGTTAVTRPGGTVIATFVVGPGPKPSPSNLFPTGRKGVTYSHTVTVAGLNTVPIIDPVVTITHLVDDLGVALGLSSSGGTITGVPTAEGFLYPYVSITCVGGSYTGGGGKIRLDAADPEFTSASTATCYVGQSFSFEVTAPDSAARSKARLTDGISAEGLPAGLTLGATDSNGTAIISGVPTGPAPCPIGQSVGVTLSATNKRTDLFYPSSGGLASQLLQLAIVDPQPPALIGNPLTLYTHSAATPPVTGVTIGTPSAPKIYANELWNGFAFYATRCPASMSVTSLPPGLTAATTITSPAAVAVVSGTPTTPGIYSMMVTPANSFGSTPTAVSIIISFRPCVITSLDGTACAQLAEWVINTVGFSRQMTASNSPQNWSAVGLPPGLGINTSTGLISGVPSAAGTYVGTITVDNIGAYGVVPADPRTSASITITITSTIAELVPVISSDLTPLMSAPNDVASGIRDVAMTYQIAATHCPASYNATSLPPGLTVNTTTGLISGTPTQVGFFSTTVFATNIWGTGSDIVEFIISYPAPIISSPLYTFGISGEEFDPPVALGGGTPAGYYMTATISDPSDTIDSYHSVDALPEGLTIDTATGVISGTITAPAGTYTVGIFATNVGAHDIPPEVPALPAPISTLQIAVYNAPPVITSISPDAVTSSGNVTMTITGTGFLPGAQVLFGSFVFVSGTNVIVVDSTTITVTVPALLFQEDPYNVVVKNLDGQADVFETSLFIIPPGSTVSHQVRYTSLYTTQSPIYDIVSTGGASNRKKRIFGLGTNVEVLFYSGIDVDENKLLNVYRKQNASTSTRHGVGDLVFKGIASIQVSPYMYKSDGGKIAHVDCLLRSNGRVDMHLRRIDGIALTEDSELLYAAYQAVLIKSLDLIPRLKIGTDECS